MGIPVKKNKVIWKYYEEHLQEDNTYSKCMVTINKFFTDEIWICIDSNGKENQINEKALRKFIEEAKKLLNYKDLTAEQKLAIYEMRGEETK